jgi:predicted amidophosphoribosyltransferase
VFARAKYRGERAALKLLARHLGEHVANARVAIDLVTWVPASRQRIERSGVDHAAIVARVCANRLHLPARECLQREPDAPQTSRDINARRAGPKVHAVRTLTGLAVLVVDDVTTTGATLAASARALRTGGARAVLAATLARTPAPGEANRGRPYTSATTPG